MISILIYLNLNVLVFCHKKDMFIESIDYKDFNLIGKKIEPIYYTFVFLSVILFYVVFLKILKIFRESIYIDLKIIIENLDKIKINWPMACIAIVLYIFFIRKIRQLVLFEFKHSFMNLNYWSLARSEIYISKYFYLCRLPQYILVKLFGKKKSGAFWYEFYNFLYFFFRFFFDFVLILLFFLDICFNNFVLIYTSSFLPFFSLYKIIYRSLMFFNTKTTMDNEDFMSTETYIWYLNDKRLLKQYNSLVPKPKTPFGAYRNISIYVLGEKPREMPLDRRESLNEYLKNMLK